MTIGVGKKITAADYNELVNATNKVFAWPSNPSRRWIRRWKGKGGPAGLDGRNDT